MSRLTQLPGEVQAVIVGGTGAVAVGTVAIWLHNTPTGSGALLTGLGQLAGFACSVLALATVVLMARIPAVDGWLGTDRALIWHRRSAAAMVGLLVVHVVATLLGYAAADAAGLWSETRTVVAHYPDMWTATVGSLLVLGVAISSIRVIRKAMRYETWLFAHWYVYPALFLVFGHELSDGSSFVGASAAIVAWTWLHVAVAVTVVWYRLVLPVWRVQMHPLRVAKVRKDGPEAVTVTLWGRGLEAYRARAGQHLRLHFLVPGAGTQSHPYSLSALPTDDTFRVTIVASGDFSRQLLGLRPGTKVLATGAHGDLTADRRLTDRVTLIGGGSGIAPLLAILEDLPPQVAARVLYRARDKRTAVLRKELEAAANARGSSVQIVIGNRHPDPTRDVLAPAKLRKVLPGIADDDVYVCGSVGFVDTVCRSLTVLGVPPERQHTERFDA